MTTDEILLEILEQLKSLNEKLDLANDNLNTIATYSINE
jgi:hypothetical protein